MPTGVYKRTKSPWNKGLTKETDERVEKSGEKSGKSRIGAEGWSKGLTKEIDERIRNLSESHKGIVSPFKGKKHSEESKEKMRGAREGFVPWNKGLTKETDERIQKYGDKQKGREKSEKERNNISKAKEGHWIGEKNPNWNPNRTEVYAPYGKIFHNKNIRNRKWNIQKGRDMLTGTILDTNKRPAYHHIDYDKSNDDLDNHCFISCSNHARITDYRPNPIKSERYKKILQENTLALRNGEIPKNWSPLNKELFRQEKLKQLNLSMYI